MDDDFVPAEPVSGKPSGTKPQDFSAPSIPSRGHQNSDVRTVLLIVGAIVVAMMLLCGGAGVFVWYTIQSAAAPAGNVTLLPSSESSSSDFERFSNATARRVATGSESAVTDDVNRGVGEEIECWLTGEFDKAMTGDGTIPGDADLFHKAVMEMHYGGNSGCYQLFLAKVGAEWRIYDWRDLDYGRRKSDEYANYFTKYGQPGSKGYDESLLKLAKAYEETDVYGGDTAKMLQELKAAETANCLPEDRPEKLLNVAWYYRVISEEDKTREILEGLVDTSVATGALATLADIHFKNGKFPEAVAAAQRLDALIPGHPAAHFQLARSLPELGQHVQAARHCLALLRLYSDENSYLTGEWKEQLDQAGTDELVRLIAESGNDELIEQDFIAWISSSWWNREWVERIQTAITKSELAETPVHLLAEGLVAASKDETASAVEKYSKLMEAGLTAALRDRAKQLRRDLLVESGDFEQLIQLEPDHDQLVLELLDSHFNDSDYYDMSRLASALEAGVGNQLEKAFGKLLLAIAYDSAVDDRAIPLLELKTSKKYRSGCVIPLRLATRFCRKTASRRFWNWNWPLEVWTRKNRRAGFVTKSPDGTADWLSH